MMKKMNVKMAVLSLLMAMIMLVGVIAGASKMTEASAAEIPTLPATEYVSPKSPTQPVPYDGVPVTPGKISSSNYRTYGLTDDNWSLYNGYYAIRNAKELYGFAELVRATQSPKQNAVLLADIVVNTDVSLENGATYTWTHMVKNPGNSAYIDGYGGTFDGNGYSISGIYSPSEKTNWGIFGSISGTGVVKNLVLKNSLFTAFGSAAPIAGYNYGLVTSCRIESSVMIYRDKTSGYGASGITEIRHTTETVDARNQTFTGGIENCFSNVTFNILKNSYANLNNSGVITAKMPIRTKVNNNYGIESDGFRLVGELSTDVAGKWTTLKTQNDAHTCIPITHNQVNGTCYSSGLSAYTFCAVCEKVLSGEKTVLYGHTSDEFFYTQNKNDELKHDKRYLCCTEIAETVDHTYNNEACSACGYEMFARMGDYASTKAKNLVITSDVTVEGDDHLHVSSGYTLTVNPGVTLTVNSNLYNAGTIINNGAIVVKGAYSGEGTVTCGETATHHPAFNEDGFCQFCGNEDYPQAAPLVDGYYQIGNAGQLMWFSNFVGEGNTSANAKLTADIIFNEGDLSGLNGKTEGYRFWTPIGMIMNHENGIDSFVTYTGTFDGDGHFISGLYHFDYWSYDGYAGLVSRLGAGGVIKNVTVQNSYIATSRLAGAILGENRGGIVENCHNVNTTVASAAKVGGIVGDNTSGVIRYCTNDGNVKFFMVNSGLAFSFAEFGGIAGDTTGTIEFCTNYGDITSADEIGSVGGISGQVYQGIVRNCVNEGNINVNGGTNFGGITGYQYHGTLTGNINYGTVAGGNLVGGVIGNPLGNGGRYTHNYTVGGNACGVVNRDGCYSITEAELANGRLAFELGIGQEIGVDARPYVGGPAVYAYFNESGVVNYTNDANYTCYHAGGTATCDARAVCDGCRNPYGDIPEGAHQFEITGREDKPNCTVCGGRCGVVAPHNTNYTDYCAVCGDWIGPELAEDGFYEIKTFGNLIWFAEQVNAGNYSLNARLMKNIVATVTFRSYDWKPIGGSSFDDTSVGYEGVFDGQGYTIALFPGTMTPEHDNAVLGLFGTLKSGAVVKNLSISNRQDNYLSSKGTTYAYDGEYTVYFGLIAGRVLSGATVSDCRVANGSVSISNGVLGAIVGINHGTVKNCVSYGMTLTGPEGRVGGIVGDYNGGTVVNCFTTYTSIGSTAEGFVGSSTGSEAGISEARMASGEITHKMNVYAGADVWYQKIGIGGPLMNSESDYIGKIVYVHNFGAITLYSNKTNEFTLLQDFEIESGKTLTIPKGMTLIIPEGVTLTNSGTLIKNGTLKGEGTLNGLGNFCMTEIDRDLLPTISDIVYDGNDHTNDVVITVSSAFSAFGKIFTPEGYTFYKSFTNVKDAGYYEIGYVLGTEEYLVSFNVTPLAVSDSNVSLEYTEVFYNGTEHQPVALLSGFEVSLGRDYFVSYENNKSAGTATATITFRGNFSGEFTKEFTIKSVVIGTSAIVEAPESIVFSGLELDPVTITVDGVRLVRNVDYTVTYENNIYPGTATAKVVGIGAVSGEVSLTFEITKPAFTVTVLDQVFPYNEDINVKPFDHTMYEGEGLVEGHSVILGEPIISGGTDEVITVLQILDANGVDVLEYYDITVLATGKYHMFYDEYTWDNDGYHWRNCAYNCDEKADYEKHHGGIVSCSEDGSCVDCGITYLFSTGEHNYVNGVCGCGFDPEFVLVVDTDNNGQHSGSETGFSANGIHNIFYFPDNQYVVIKDFAGDFSGVGKNDTTVILDLRGHTIDMTDALYPFSMQAQNLVVLFKSTTEEMGVLIGATQLAADSVTFTLDNIRHEGTLYNMGTIHVINGSLLYSKITNRGTIYLPEGYDLSTIVSYTGNGTLYVGEKAFVYNEESGKLECVSDHDWVDADCTNAKYCSICEKIDGEPLGHSTNGPATCEEDEVCTVCSAVVNEKLGHTEEEIPAVEPGCDTVGSTVGSKCAICGEILVTPEELPARGHTEASPVIENVVNNGCDAPGSYEVVVYCTVCDYEFSRETVHTDVIGHTETTTEHSYKAPTCQEEGYVIYRYTCTVCGEYRDSERITLEATGHTPGESYISGSMDPSCSYEGYVTTITPCANCSVNVEEKKEIIPMLPHTPNIEAPTCTQEQSCTVCYALIESFAPHDYVETVHEATCSNQGGNYYQCSDCGHSYFEPTQEALGHDYNIEAAACEEDKYCLRCDVVMEYATGHDDVWATCTTPHYCATCNEVLSPATGHNFNAADAPTCTIDKYCISCGYVEAEALGHNPDKEAPTCDEPVYCTRCPALLEDAIGHTYNNEGGVTCTEDYYCTTCGEIFGYARGHVPMFGSVQCEVDNTCIHCGFVVEEAAGHNYKTETLREVSCQGDGVISHTCQRCYYSYEEYQPQLEHDLVKQDDVPSTCLQQGHTGATVCSLCGQVFATGTVLPFAEHQDLDGNELCDVCGIELSVGHDCVDGDSNHKCDVCDTTLTVHEVTDGKHTCHYCGERASDCEQNEFGYCDICQVKIIGQSVHLGAGISMRYFVQVIDPSLIEGKNVTMEFHFMGDVRTVEGDFLSETYILFSFEGIAPEYMGENIDAYFLIDGQRVASKLSYSVKTNLTNLLAKNANDEKLVQLINDTLAYGAAAQKAKNYNADAPVTDGVEGFAPSQNVPTDQTVVENNTDETAKIESYEVIVGKVAYFRFAIKLATFDGITIRVNGEEISLDHLVVKGGGDYVLLSEGLNMGLDSPDFTVEILKDGVSVSKVATGVGACANEVASTEQKNLLIAIYNLLASTQAYLWE